MPNLSLIGFVCRKLQGVPKSLETIGPAP